MNKVAAGAGALVLAGVGSVVLAGAVGAQSVDEIPSYPGTALEVDVSGGVDGVVDLGRPGFSNVNISSGSQFDGCTLDAGQVLAAVDIEIWQFDADNEPQLLESGYAASDIDFWGGDISEFISEAELDRWTSAASIYGAFGSTGKIALAFEPPASSGEQVFIGTCIVVDREDTMEGSLEDLERSDEAFVATYTVNAGGGDNGGGDGDGDGPGGDGPGGDDDGDSGGDDNGSTPALTPVAGTPILTG
jgi:hypothetical protein